MKRWITYTITLCFAVYWASNLILWFPWSYSEVLGITLMLTLAPLIWIYATYLALISYPGSGIWSGAGIVTLIFLTLAVVMDYIFFGHIRNAMEELYHPTTFYGYGFLILLPFIIALIIRRRINKLRRMITNSDLIKSGIIGIFCLIALILIILLDIKI